MAKKPKASWGPKGAWVIPKTLMEHSDFQELTPAATKVLMVLACQYNGRNNGDLAATHTMLTRWSGMPNETLARALRELREKNLIIQSRHHLRGVDGAKPALYALTWLRIDPCPSKGLNIGDTLHAPRSLS